ncbi:aspartate aminotransferase family protein [Patescibacteria group bacterium]|nr:aspartate aminotransferase family protein [Patescibacteria group bacterium]MBU1886080.1 aspartate aminotransferase family protein [Patescibacteria group bacterium]
MIKHNIVYNPVVDWRFDLAKAEGSLLWDKEGKQYIDFSSGWNTTNLGWNNPEVNKAVSDQAHKNVYAPMWTADEVQSKYAKKLTDAFPEELDVVCRATGGTEANEMALKIARAVTGRSQIVSFAHTYHGQSFGTLALGFVPAYVKQIAPLVPEFIQMDYPNAFAEQPEEKTLEKFLTELEKHLKTEKVAAVFTEPGLITGWGSMLQAPKGYLTAVRELTQKYGTLLVVDEVGTGFSRTGKLFGIEHEEVIPDIVTLAKGISNGAGAIGAVVTKGKMVEEYAGAFKPTSTFGWNPLACAAALKNLEIHQRDKVWEEADRKGKLVKAELEKQLSDDKNMQNLRGLGLEIAFDISSDNKEGEDNSELSTVIVDRCFEKGLHLADAGDCIQIMPPLTISEDQLKEGLETLISVIKSL